MRLIDANAFLSKNCMALKGPNDGNYDSCSECLREPHGYCCMEVKGDEIYNAPTIDAIPVEWLENKRKEALHEGMRPDEVEAVDVVLWMWKKEQEVNT